MAATVPPTQGLAGRRIAISPGHGYYLNGTTWGLQRPFLQGIVEDFVNHDIVTHLNSLLVAGGADVRPTRNVDRGAGNGESGFPKWQEAARYHVKALGADASVWNEAGFTHLEQDIRCRPRYANAVEAELRLRDLTAERKPLMDEAEFYKGRPLPAKLKQALDAGAVSVLLDDFSPADMQRAVSLNAGRALLEASGGINFDTVRAIAETGVDRISIGALTKDVKATDFSMRFRDL